MSKLESSDDDAPVEISFKDLKKKKFALSTNLKADFEEAKRLENRRKHFRDPRFDPKVNGVCVVDDWSHLKNSEAETAKVRSSCSLSKSFARNF